MTSQFVINAVWNLTDVPTDRSVVKNEYYFMFTCRPRVFVFLKEEAEEKKNWCINTNVKFVYYIPGNLVLDGFFF